MPGNPDKHIHIISFDIPYPPDYGGVIDVFHKIRALSESGIKVHLHCFHHGREKNSMLEKICYSVSYYERKHGINYLFRCKPYIVATRSSQELIDNLAGDNHPVVYEGLHTTMSAGRKELSGRILIVRMHNIESGYYGNLFRNAGSISDRLYFGLEALKLDHYERNLGTNLGIACISKDDTTYFREKYPGKFRVIGHIPPFHENSKVRSKPGQGSYVLYHGNLSVCENEKMVLFILEKISARMNIPFIIAGKNPSKKIIETTAGAGNVRLISNPDEAEMDNLMLNAQIHLLPAGNVSGMKLKLLNSLYKGRYCIADKAMVKNTGLETLCDTAENPEEYLKIIARRFRMNFEIDELVKRETLLDQMYSNIHSARLLIEMAGLQ
jgi:hypothetical protein